MSRSPRCLFTGSDLSRVEELVGGQSASGGRAAGPYVRVRSAGRPGLRPGACGSRAGGSYTGTGAHRTVEYNCIDERPRKRDNLNGKRPAPRRVWLQKRLIPNDRRLHSYNSRTDPRCRTKIVSTRADCGTDVFGTYWSRVLASAAVSTSTARACEGIGEWRARSRAVRPSGVVVSRLAPASISAASTSAWP